MAKRFKVIKHTNTIEDAILSGCSEIEILKDEMEEWASNMEEKLSQTEKFGRVEEAAQTLGSPELNPDIPEIISGDLRVTYFEERPYGSKSPSRATRLANAISMLSAGVAGIEEIIDHLDEEKSALEIEANGKREDAEGEIEDAEADEEPLSDEDKAAKRAEAADAATILENDAEKLEEDRQTLEDFKDEIQNIIDEVESVEFPGMYG